MKNIIIAISLVISTLAAQIYKVGDSVSDFSGSLCPDGNQTISLNDYNSNVEGDVNEDGLINVLDVVELVNCILENCSSSVDINGDGILNIIDIVQLVNMILS